MIIYNLKHLLCLNNRLQRALLRYLKTKKAMCDGYCVVIEILGTVI